MVYDHVGCGYFCPCFFEWPAKQGGFYSQVFLHLFAWLSHFKNTGFSTTAVCHHMCFFNHSCLDLSKLLCNASKSGSQNGPYLYINISPEFIFQVSEILEIMTKIITSKFVMFFLLISCDNSILSVILLGKPKHTSGM